MPEIDPHEKYETHLWVEKYGDYLYRFALMRLRDPQVAEDTVQETFLAALKNLHQFDGRVDVKYWLRGILRNKTVDYVRKSVRRQELQDEQVQETGPSIPMPLLPRRNSGKPFKPASKVCPIKCGSPFI
jgi:RNA polymerase sigma factor (sigma-70 family)